MVSVFFLFPPENKIKKKNSQYQPERNLQPEGTGAAMCLSITLWHLIMRILGSVNSISSTWATCQRDWMAAAEQNTAPA